MSFFVPLLVSSTNNQRGENEISFHFRFYSTFLIIIFACDDSTSLPNESQHEYVIVPYNEDNPEDQDWFKVIDIESQIYHTVPAVIELEGSYYLPIMSKPTSFNNKVVEGDFYLDQPLGSTKPDTVFKVTKHLRDTVITYL